MAHTVLNSKTNGRDRSISMSKLVGAIDQGTSSSRFMLFSETGKIVAMHQKEIESVSLKPGWLEQNPMELLSSVKECMDSVMEGEAYCCDDIVSIGITNQRETTILWDRITGKPLYNAIVWSDSRTEEVCKKLESDVGSKDYFRDVCGLPISTYFSAMKIKWMMENVEDVRKAVADKRCMFGTVDSWIIWNLTGGTVSGVHATDVTNASRTMLMDLQSCSWDESSCREIGIPMSILPNILSCSEEYGTVSDGPLKGAKICGCVGDQQAALIDEFSGIWRSNQEMSKIHMELVALF
eukprot:272878_1